MKGTQREIPAWIAVVILVLAGARASLDAGLLRLPPPSIEGVAWLPLEAARQTASRQRKPLLVDVTADWCAPCRRMDEETWTDDDVADLVARSFVASRVVQSSDPAVASPGEAEARRELGVEAFPTLLVLLPGDDRPLRVTGFLSPAETRRFLESALLRHLAAGHAARRGVSARRPPDAPSR